MKNKDALRIAHGNFAPARKRLRKAKHSDVKAALFMWFKDARAQKFQYLVPFSRKRNMQRGLLLMISNVVMGAFMDSNVVTTYSSYVISGERVTSQPNRPNRSMDYYHTTPAAARLSSK